MLRKFSGDPLDWKSLKETFVSSVHSSDSIIQKQSSRGALKKRCSENMPKCDFNKVALQL